MRNKLLLIIGIFFLISFLMLLPLVTKFTPVLWQLLVNKGIDLKKNDDRINMLLLGIGGGIHEGPDLSDSIIFVSIDQNRNRVTLLSIPRDLWIPELNEKINTAYTIGKFKKSDGGITLTSAIVSKIVNQPIDYVAVINFEGFEKAVDLIGGLDITIDRAFDDFEYPAEAKKEDLCGHQLDEATALIATQSPTLVFPCRYEHVRFEQGREHMNGERALIYVRSRYAIGEEGTDFARSIRQQRVIKAFKDKVLSPTTLLNPIRITNLYSVVAKSIDTNIAPSEIDDFLRLAGKMKRAELHSAVLEQEDKEQGKKGLLTNPKVDDYGGAWVLIPKAGNGNYTKIQAYVSCLFVSNSCSIP